MNSEQQYTILFLDDETNILRSVKRLFVGRKHKLVIVDDGQKALDFMQNNPVHVVVSDVKMPNMSGDVFLEKVAESYPNTHRIVLSGFADSDVILRLVNNGKIHRFIQKPWVNDALLSAVEEGIAKFKLKEDNVSLQSQLEVQNKRLQTLNNTLEERVELRTLQVKTSLKQAKQGAHTIKKVLLNTFTSVNFIDITRGKYVSTMSEKLAAVLKLDAKQTSDISFAGLIHEIGMLPLGDKVYSLAYTKMSPSEQELYLNQAKNAKHMLSSANQLSGINESVFNQFEYINGKGFPEKLSGDEIPLGAQIIAVAREYLRYKTGLYDLQQYNSTVALSKIHNYAGIHYSEEVYDALVKVVENEDLLEKQKNDCLSSSDLKPGMVLSEGIYNDKDILIMPESHVIDEACITKLQKIEQETNTKFDIFIR